MKSIAVIAGDGIGKEVPRVDRHRVAAPHVLHPPGGRKVQPWIGRGIRG